MTYVRKSTNRSKRKNRSKRNYRKKTNNLKYSRNKNTRKKLAGGADAPARKAAEIPFIAALLSHITITRANLLHAFPDLAADDGQVSEETLMGIFKTPINRIDENHGFAIFNVEQYDPIPGTGITTGHIFMVAYDADTQKIGSIGFYPVNYRSYFGLAWALFGDTGALVTPDPIAKKYSAEGEDINNSAFKLIKYSAAPIKSTHPHALKKLNDTLSKGSIKSFRETSMYETDINYQPLAVGQAENCLTYIQNHLDINLDAVGSVPNYALGTAEASPLGTGEAAASLANMVGYGVEAVGNMLSSGYGGSRKRLRRKSKNKRNNIKKTRRRRINKY